MIIGESAQNSYYVKLTLTDKTDSTQLVDDKPVVEKAPENRRALLVDAEGEKEVADEDPEEEAARETKRIAMNEERSRSENPNRFNR